MTVAETREISSKGSDSAPDFLVGGGEISDQICNHDWSRTSLGPIAGWPTSLKVILRMVIGSRQPICLFWGPDLLNFHNAAYEPMLGKRKRGAIGKPAAELWSDVWQDVLPFVRTALSGQGMWMEELPLVMTRNGYDEQTYWTFSYSPLHDDDGNVAGLINIVTEKTGTVADRRALQRANESLAESYGAARRHIEEQQQAERRQQLLQRELAHRMKNTLSIAQAVVSQSMRHSENLEQAGAMIAGRLAALSRAQDILTETHWASARLGDVVATALKPHRDGDGDRFVIDGPHVEISAQQAFGMALAVHELATNAAKYGALSAARGRVSIRWSADGDALRFEWRESDGPRVSEPSRRGFGSRLTERIVAGYFNGEARIDYNPDGLGFVLDGRLDSD